MPKCVTSDLKQKAAATHMARVAVVTLLFLGSQLSIAAQTPYSGTPIPVPGTWEAENFDLGGEGVAYHDNGAGNAGGQYRPSEDVDIIVSSDPQGGGYVVNNFETGEWMIYTIQVPSSGLYGIAARASNNNWSPPPAFHLEVDGVSVPGPVIVPSTGSWNVFAWVTKGGVSLTAGQHVLKMVSDQQYFDLNQIRVTATPPQPNDLLFWSGYENASTMDPSTECW